MWRDVLNYEGEYVVNELGEIARLKDGVVMKQYPQKSGYVNVHLPCGNGRSKAIPVHRIVCIAFHGVQGYIDGLYVDHINTIRSDNRAENLRWVTPKENANNPTTKLNRRKKKTNEH